MTTTETAGHTEPSSSDVDTDTPDSDATDVITDDDAGEDTGQPNREAQKYRRRAQTAEAERDQLRGQLDTLQRQLIGDMCVSANLDPRLLTAAGYDVPALLDDDGALDRQKIADAITATTQEFPGRNRPRPNQQQGMRNAAASTSGVGATINKALGRG